MRKVKLKRVKPIVVYPSSTIQQNHGESVDGHGWCLWDVSTCTHEFKSLPNNFGYFTVEMQNGKLPTLTNVPKNVRMRIFSGTLDATGVKKVVSVLRKQYNIIELSVNKARNTKLSRDKIRNNMDAVDVQNISVQNNLIQDWLERSYDNTISPKLMQEILEINKNLNTVIQHDDHSRNINWRPLQLKFSNMFSYGEDNIINFSKMKGIYGIFAANASGKSSAIDALIFTLYDKTPRAFKGDHIMNNRKNEFSCQLKFEIDNQIFYIRRTGTRKKNTEVKVDVSFWKENSDGTHEILNGQDRRDTNSIIRNYVGSYEDFVLTALSGQTSNALFIDKSHSERKDLLIQFMGLSIFDILCDTANSEIKEVTGLLKKFKKVDFTQNLSDIQNKLDISRDEHTRIESSFIKIKNEQDLLYAKLKDLQNQKKPVPDIELDIDKLHSELKTAHHNHAASIDHKKDAEHKLSDVQSILHTKAEILEEMDVETLKTDVNEFNRLSELLKKEHTSLKLTLSKIVEKETFQKKLSAYKYNLDCNVCVENNKSIISDKKALIAELSELNNSRQDQENAVTDIHQQLSLLNDKVNLYKQSVELQAEINQLQKTIGLHELAIQKLITAIEKYDRQIEQCTKDISLHTANKANILHNIELDNKIKYVEYDITANKNKISQIEKILRDLHGEIKVLESGKVDIMAQIKEAERLESIHEAYKYYMEAIGRDGIPYELMRQAIPNIESEINNILSQIVDFNISLEVDGKNIVGKINYDYDRYWPLENCSGMERFISSLAIRVALMNASNLPKSNFLIIDEGLGTLDAENLTSMHTLFSILKNQFDFMLVISHLDSARDMVDYLIEIKKDNGFSYIDV